MKNIREILSFINLDRYPICQDAVEAWARTALQGLIDDRCRALMNNTFHT